MNLLENLGIHPQSVTADQAIITIDVSDRLMQPYGIVHGGINAVLAETATSLAANAWLNRQNREQVAIGVNITTEHLLPVASGEIIVKAQPLKRGRTIQTWFVKEFNGTHLTSTSTVTLANRPKPQI